MIKNLLKRWLGINDVQDLLVGGHCGLCGKYLPKSIVTRFNTWTKCSHDCLNHEIIYIPSTDDKLSALLLELRIMEEDIERTTFPIGVDEVSSRLRSIKQRYKAFQ